MNDAINWSYDYAFEFANALIASKAGIRWTDSLMLVNLDAKLVNKLRASGLVRADVGVETASRRLRRMIRKPLSSSQVLERLRLLHEHGIWCDINMIVGLPHEQEDDFEETRLFLKEAAQYYTNCAVNNFYLIGSSPMGQEPECFGITVRPGMRMTKDGLRLPFDEIGGVAFKERLVSGRKSASDLRETIARYGGPRPSSLQALAWRDAWEEIPYHLMFFLYDIYGHEKKASIQKICGDLLEGLVLSSPRPTPTPPPAPIPPFIFAEAKNLCRLLRDALLSGQPPNWAGFRLGDVFMREHDPAVWLGLERDGSEPILLRLFRIRGPEDRFAARLGPLGLSSETPGPVSQEIVSAVLKSLLQVLRSSRKGAGRS